MSARQALNEAATHRKALRYAEAAAALAPWVESVRERPVDDLGLTFEVLTAQTHTLACLGREHEALALSTLCLTLAQRHADVVRRNESMAFVIATQFSRWADAARADLRGSPASLLKVLDAGAEFVRLGGKPTWQAGILAAKASVLSGFGQVSEAASAREQAIALKAIDRTSPGITWVSMRMGQARDLMQLGRREEGVQLLGDLLEEGVDGMTALGCHCYRGHGLLDLGRYAEAAEHADRALALASTSPRHETSALGLAVEAYLSVGRMEDASAAAQRILALARRSGNARDLCSAWQDTADVALWSLDEAAAAAAIEEMARYVPQVDGYHGTDERARLLAERRQRLEWLRQGDLAAVRRPVRGNS